MNSSNLDVTVSLGYAAMARADLVDLRDRGLLTPALAVLERKLDAALWQSDRRDFLDPAVVAEVRAEASVRALRTTD